MVDVAKDVDIPDAEALRGISDRTAYSSRSEYIALKKSIVSRLQLAAEKSKYEAYVHCSCIYTVTLVGAELEKFGYRVVTGKTPNGGVSNYYLLVSFAPSAGTFESEENT